MDVAAQDGSIDAAVAAMANIDLASGGQVIPPPPADPRPVQQRNQRGEYASNVVQLPPGANAQLGPQQNALLQEQQAEAAAEPEPTEEVASAAEEWFELPPEKDGETPTRIKAEDVFRGYQEREALAREVEQLRRGTPPPQAYADAVSELAQLRTRLLDAIETQEAMLRPMRPDRELMNPDSQRYNPDAYYRQTMAAEDMERHVQALQQQKQQHSQRLSYEQDMAAKARAAIEWNQLLQAWPEIRTPSVRTALVDGAYRHYGLTEQDVNSLSTASHLLVLRDALALHEGRKAAQQAVKVVRSKPKLVRGPARTQGDPKAGHLHAAMSRVRQTNSEEDAAEAIGLLLQQ